MEWWNKDNLDRPVITEETVQAARDFMIQNPDKFSIVMGGVLAAQRGKEVSDSSNVTWFGNPNLNESGRLTQTGYDMIGAFARIVSEYCQAMPDDQPASEDRLVRGHGLSLYRVNYCPKTGEWSVRLASKFYALAKRLTGELVEESDAWSGLLSISDMANDMPEGQ